MSVIPHLHRHYRNLFSGEDGINIMLVSSLSLTAYFRLYFGSVFSDNW